MTKKILSLLTIFLTLNTVVAFGDQPTKDNNSIDNASVNVADELSNVIDKIKQHKNFATQGSLSIPTKYMNDKTVNSLITKMETACKHISVSKTSGEKSHELTKTQKKQNTIIDCVVVCAEGYTRSSRFNCTQSKTKSSTKKQNNAKKQPVVEITDKDRKNAKKLCEKDGKHVYDGTRCKEKTDTTQADDTKQFKADSEKLAAAFKMTVAKLNAKSK